MRSWIFTLLILLAASGAQAQASRPAPWRAALRDWPELDRAGGELLALCTDGGPAALAGRLDPGRVRLFLREPRVPDGLYGRCQSRALLARWVRGREDAIPALLLAYPDAEGRGAVFLMEWRDEGRILPMTCRLELDGDSWRLREVRAP